MYLLSSLHLIIFRENLKFKIKKMDNKFPKHIWGKFFRINQVTTNYLKQDIAFN